MNKYKRSCFCEDQSSKQSSRRRVTEDGHHRHVLSRRTYRQVQLLEYFWKTGHGLLAGFAMVSQFFLKVLQFWMTCNISTQLLDLIESGCKDKIAMIGLQFCKLEIVLFLVFERYHVRLSVGWLVFVHRLSLACLREWDWGYLAFAVDASSSAWSVPICGHSKSWEAKSHWLGTSLEPKEGILDSGLLSYYTLPGITWSDGK